ncbi:unnamed protein product [Thelazia callipaeda]|uniref:PH domain-containing protein n=1 Tax=Thelazia callipaeda TaxID=103827 RepID=A0A158RD41_THECL|nr:unnamed protein product [Thelazia callipaeda]
MNEQRQIVKSGWLQHVIHKKGGTLHRKKKVLYEEGKWVVLCIHNDRIPLLEWYFSEKCVYDHRPSKVIDLLDSSFVRIVISDPSRRSFMIGFVDCKREPIELAALTVEDCDDWIRSSTSELMRIKCLVGSTNLYISIPDAPSEVPELAERLGDQDQAVDEFSKQFRRIQSAAVMFKVPEGIAPSLPNSTTRNLAYERIKFPAVVSSRVFSLPHALNTEEKKMKSLSPVTTPPPLPPRNISSSRTHFSMRIMERLSIYDHPKNRASAPSNDSFVAEHSEDASMNLKSSAVLESPISLNMEIEVPVDVCRVPVKRGYSVPTGTLNADVTQSYRTTTDDSSSSNYDAPCGLLNQVTSFRKNHSVSQRNNDEQHENNSQFFGCFDAPNNLKHITVDFIIFMHHIAFVDFDGKVWVAGWTMVAHKSFTDQLFVGDQLVQVGDVVIQSTQQFSHIFNPLRKSESMVNVIVQRVPHGSIYTLQKMEENFDAGFILDKYKSKLLGVLEGSSAWEAGVRSSVSAVTQNGTTSACITHINNSTLNLFSRNNDVSKIIDELPLLSAFTIIVQPYDFIKFLKKNLKKLKNANDFVY